jgi:K+-transporting ATPase ATPase C chain
VNPLSTALRFTLATFLLTGLAYPFVATGLAQLLFPYAANGSLVESEGRVVGSRWIGQAFSKPGYLQPRPSAAGAGYDAAATSGSNYGPTSAKLRERAAADVERLLAENPDAPRSVPVELATASGSGLDPHVSPDAARWQAPRIARARGVGLERVLAVLDEHVEGRTLGILGEPRVNVLAVNLALDRRFGRPGQ